MQCKNCENAIQNGRKEMKFRNIREEINRITLGLISVIKLRFSYTDLKIMFIIIR